MAVRSIKLTVQYDGSQYHGWQIQPRRKTIQGELVEAVSSLVGTRTHVHGASRTDAGVSALGQVALFEIDSPIPTENFPEAISGRLPREIVVTAAEEAPRKFDLMGGPKSKLYRYTICTGRHRPVLRLNQCWHVPRKLDAAAMNRAAQQLVGTKDFKSFATAKDKREQTVRTIFHCEVTAEDKWIYVDVEGDAFLYNMVRNIV
ncbi:MAG: tRNA pseudouridine(38-40) synthase TruA, partial [Planctomycetota bacterium]